MIQAFCFLHRRRSLDRAGFREYWRESHAPLLAATPSVSRHLLRYEQNPRLASDDGDGYDGVALLSFAAPDAFRAFAAEPAYREQIRTDELRFLDLDRLTLVVTGAPREILPLGEERSTAEIKLLTLLRRKPGISLADFDRHWSEVHAPIVREAMGRHLLGYSQNSRIADTGPEDYDGVAVVGYASRDGFRAAIGDGAYSEKIAPDEERFLDRDALEFVMTGPTHVVWDRS